MQALDELRSTARVAPPDLSQGDLLEQVVAPEQLVSTLPRRDDGDPGLARGPGQEHQRHRCGTDQRCLAMQDRVAEAVRDLPGADLEHVVLGAERLRRRAPVAALVVARVGERDRERLQRMVGGLLRERRGQARVQAPGEVRADRDVGAQAQTDAVGEQLAQVLFGGDRVAARAPTSAPIARSGPAPRPRALRARPAQRRRSTYAATAVPERERLVEAVEVGRGRHLPGGEQRARLRSEDKRATDPGAVMQRAHAEAARASVRRRGPGSQ